MPYDAIASRFALRARARRTPEGVNALRVSTFFFGDV